MRSFPRCGLTLTFAFAMLLSFLFLVCGKPAFAGDEWPRIDPAELKMTSVPEAPGAPAVVLYRQVDRTDNARVPSKEIEYVRMKILTEAGRKYGSVELPFAKDREDITGVRARTIHPDGSIANFDGKVLESTIVKASGIQYLAKVFSMPDVQVGSIIEYEILRDFPKWQGQYGGLYGGEYGGRGYVNNFTWMLSSELFTLHAKFFAKPYTEHGLQVQWSWPVGLPVGTKPPEEGGDGVVRLEARNIPARPIEDHMPPISELTLRVVFTYSTEVPEKDQDKFWREFDRKQCDAVEKFIGKGAAVRGAVNETVSPQDAPEAKLRKLYARVQKIRNLSYELRKTAEERAHEGIKENTTAEEVWTNGYGYKRQIDWLFLQMARIAGFEADPVLVSNRKQYFFNKSRMQSSELGFTAVAVKTDGGEILLDPGGYLAPFGFLPWEETGVPALKLDKQSGSWIQTKLGSSDTTQIRRQADLRLSPEGALEGNLTVTYSGQQAYAKRIDQMREDEGGRRKALEDEVKRYIPAVSEVELTNQPDWNSSESTLRAEFHVKIPGWALSSGKRTIVASGLFGNSEKGLFEHASRTHAIYFEYPYGVVDEIKLSVPEGWQVEGLPKPATVDLKAAKFSFDSQAAGNIVILRRDLRIDFVLMEQKFYPTVRSFFQSVRSADGQQITLLPRVAVSTGGS